MAIDTLLLPGMDGTGRLFGSLQRHLPRDIKPRVVAFPGDAPLDYDQLLRAIDVPTGPFAIVAESFSGALGIRLAHRYPGRVGALVLVATFVKSPSRVARGIAAAGPFLVRARLPDAALRWALLGLDANHDDVRATRSAIESVDVGVLFARIRAIASVDVTAEFAATRSPLLYIAGRRDRLVGPSVRESLQSIHPEMEVHVLDAPHLVLQTRPAESAGLIAKFLRRRFATRPGAS